MSDQKPGSSHGTPAPPQIDNDLLRDVFLQLERHGNGQNDSQQPPAGQSTPSPDYLRRLASLYERLDDLIVDFGDDPHDVFRTVSRELQDIFHTSYVEFLMLRGNTLEYSYITAPDWMLEITHRLTGITAVRGMIIPLFEGSSFKAFVDGARPRELIAYEDRLKSFQDFLPPTTTRNRWIRDHLGPVLMKFFAYDYVFQVPLLVHRKIFGYFSFLQRGRLDERQRMDIVMLSEKIAHLLALKRHVEERKRHTASLQQGVLVVEQISPGRFRIVDSNAALHSILQIEHASLQGKDISSLGLSDLQHIHSLLHHVHGTGTSEVRDLSLPELDVHLRVTVSRTDDHELMIVFDDISENIRTIRLDRLTGVMNRPTLMDAFAHEISKAERTHATLAVFFLDLNGFKEINDRCGHRAGDQVLQEVAAAIRGTLRKTDLLGRYGGDEFVVVAEIKEPRFAATITQKIQAAVAALQLTWDGEAIEASVSIGHALFDPTHPTTLEMLIQESDRQMYASKRSGSHRCHRSANAIPGNR